MKWWRPTGNAPVYPCLQGRCITLLPRPHLSVEFRVQNWNSGRSPWCCPRQAEFWRLCCTAGARPFRLEVPTCRPQNASRMKHQNLQARTKRFALQIVEFCETVQKDDAARVLSRQLLRSGTSVGANYRASCNGRSRAEFIARLALVLDESDESEHWFASLWRRASHPASNSSGC